MDKAKVYKYKANGLRKAMKLMMESEQFMQKCQSIGVLRELFSTYTPVL